MTVPTGLRAVSRQYCFSRWRACCERRPWRTNDMADEDDDLALGADMDDDEEDDTGIDDDQQTDDDLEGEAVGGGWVATGEVERPGDDSEASASNAKPALP